MIDKRNNPLVSIIMNCFNGEKFLNEAIESVLAQTYQNWELIIWDNCSTDSTNDIANSYKDNRIHYYQSLEFVKLGKARNMAIKKSRGEIIGFLDCDDIYLPTKLEKQVPLFNNPKVGIVICDTLFFNNEGYQKQLYKKRNPPSGMVFRELLSKYFISLETTLIRRKSLDSLEYWFDSNYQMIEEYDLFVRLGYYWELDFCDQILAKWRVHDSSWTWSRFELFPIEKKSMLNNLENFIENFKINYSFEIQKVKQSIAIDEAKISWQNGNPKMTRKFLKPYIVNNRKCFLLYFMTFFPFQFYLLLQNFRKKKFN